MKVYIVVVKIYHHLKDNFIHFVVTILSKHLVKFSMFPFPCPFPVLAIALLIYYTSVPSETETKNEVK